MTSDERTETAVTELSNLDLIIERSRYARLSILRAYGVTPVKCRARDKDKTAEELVTRHQDLGEELLRRLALAATEEHADD